MGRDVDDFYVIAGEQFAEVPVDLRLVPRLVLPDDRVVISGGWLECAERARHLALHRLGQQGGNFVNQSLAPRLGAIARRGQGVAQRRKCSLETQVELLP